MSESFDHGFAAVNGLEVYYEIHGTGEPLLMLHGGVSASEVFGDNLTEFAKSRQVIVAHLQGHGHTRDIDRPFRFEFMADDAAALIAHLGLGQVDILGYSLGGGVAIQTAILHPDVVRKLVVVSEVMRPDGWYPDVLEALKQLATVAPHVAANLRQSPMAEMYPHVDWEVLFTKMGDMETHTNDWSAGVAGITAPTMLVFADADGIDPAHMVEFFKLLGGGQRDAGLDGSLRPTARLAILPGTTHYDILATTAVANAVIPFLDAALSPVAE